MFFVQYKKFWSEHASRRLASVGSLPAAAASKDSFCPHEQKSNWSTLLPLQ